MKKAPSASFYPLRTTLAVLALLFGNASLSASNVASSFSMELPPVEPDSEQSMGIWRLENGAQVTEQDGETVIALPAKRDAVTFNSSDLGLDYSWTADPFGEYFLRPGSVVSINFSMANEGDKGVLYVRPAGASNGNGLASFQGSPAFVSSWENTMIERTVCATLSPKPVQGKRIGILFLNSEENPVRMIPPKTIQALHPLLKVEGPEKLTAGPVQRNESFVSEEFTITNAQEQVFEQVLSSDAGPQPIPTLLYGTADLESTERPDGEYELTFGKSVGVVLVGKDAGLFLLESSSATEDGKGVTLGLSESEPGLPGGPSPQNVTFRLKFQGSANPGVFTAAIRIATQAVNAGNQSTGGADTPPWGIFYQDIPVSVTVR